MASRTLHKNMAGGALLLGVFCATIVGYAASVATAARQQGREGKLRPNIVLIMADDVGSEVLGCYGGTSYRTRRIDSLADTGIRFSNCFSMPVCHPSRQTIMTGQYPFRHPTAWGSWPEGVITFAHMLKQVGYATAVAGKWQLVLQKNNPTHPAQLGFDESAVFGWHEGPRFHNPMIYRNGVVWEENRKPDIYGPEVYTEFLIDFMARNKDRPFFAYYPMALCHEVSDDFKPVPPPGPDGRYRSFAEMVDDMDAAVGRIVTALDRLDLRRETVILFTTDNGSPVKYLTGVEHSGGKIIRHHQPVISMLGDKAVAGGKGSMADAGTRVPLLASWPGTTPNGHTCNDLIDFSDFLPTLAELASAPLPNDAALDGQSFAPQLKGSPGDSRQWVFCEHGGKRWVRSHRWKLYTDGRLIDVQNDPLEKSPSGSENESPQAAVARSFLENAFESLAPPPKVGFRTKSGEAVLTVTTPLNVSNGGTMFDSQGRKNGESIWGKTADWCGYSGTVDDRLVGMTLMCHPANFRASWMHARDYGFIAANPFGRKAFTEGAPSKVVVEPGEELRLRYGVLLHDEPLDLKAAYEDYLQLSQTD